MAQYRIGAKYFGDGRVYRSGDLVTVPDDRPPAASWAPLDSGARTAKAAAILGRQHLCQPQTIANRSSLVMPIQNCAEVLATARSVGFAEGTLEQARAYLREWATHNAIPSAEDAAPFACWRT